MESVRQFLEEVTDELLYNIVYDADEIDYRDLSEEFKKKTGNRITNFFGLGNQTGGRRLDFIRGIPGVRVDGAKQISICDSDEDTSDDDSSDEGSEEEDDAPHVYKIFNSTYFIEGSVAKYREMLLIRCCKIMKDNLSDLSDCKDDYGNTPLHFIAALPGINYDCDTLVKYLLKAGVDPLATNHDGKTFLHIIFGRFKAEDDGLDSLSFGNERVARTKWYFQDRVELLKLLSKKLSQKDTNLLSKAQDGNGNTVLHEYAMSTTPKVPVKFTEEDKLSTKLEMFGASLRIPNNSGEVPLHYAYNSSVFKIFLQKGAVCRARNDRDETPVLFSLKNAVDLMFAQASVTAELADQGFVETTSSISVHKAVKLLENLESIVSENEEARKTIWIPDMEGNTAIDVVLIAIRITSYSMTPYIARLAQLQLSLVELLRKMLRRATPSDMKRQNKKRQSLLHVLLDMGDGNKHTIIEEEYIVLSLQILLDHNADVNAVDSKGRTPLDITRKLLNKGLVLYKECADLLIQSGATGKRGAGNDSSLSQSSLLREMSNLRINDTRKLRSCPKRHLKKAERLIDPNTAVTVVEKYRYSNQAKIGTGAFSSVFVAIKDENVDDRSGAIECRAYALKRLDKSKINPQKIKREITTLLSISGQCENIIKCHGVEEDPYFKYIFHDLMDGDLHEFVDNDDVNKVMNSPAIRVQIAKEIINGLAYLHEKKYIHCDLNPGNILYTTDPSLRFKIADFGLTKKLPKRESSVSVETSTRCWMAPELVSVESTEREHTKASDIFSLGLVLHYLLTLGEHPFATEDEEEDEVIIENIINMQIHLDNGLNREARNFLCHLLNEDPFERPPAKNLNLKYSYLWSDGKKMEFLKAVGADPEVKDYYSELGQNLQTTNTGRRVERKPWNVKLKKLYEEMTDGRRSYRTDMLIELLRFIRNAYAHKQERSEVVQDELDENIFLKVFPSLVLDVLDVVRQLRLHKKRSCIRQALQLDI